MIFHWHILIQQPVQHSYQSRFLIISMDSVDTPKIRAVSLFIKFTEYDTKKNHPEVQDANASISLKELKSGKNKTATQKELLLNYYCQ
ncbi:hypothetical protein D2V93_06940 [Flagellimonas taeanensis]|nr:hypothetical protein D2V93_06940 [Allomuricauda taeanensis]